MSISDCCLKGFEWEGTPTGTESTLETELGTHSVYTAGKPDSPRALLIVTDIFGWKFPNSRLLADHFAKEADITVYVPDFFAGEELNREHILAERYDLLDMPSWAQRNSRQVREPEIFAVAKLLRSKHAKVTAAGYCYGGWAVLRMAAKEHQPPLLDAAIVAHPSMAIEKDFDEVGVPLQILAPEFDHVYTPELKSHSLQALQRSGVYWEYVHFPGVTHGCMTRGDEKKDGERKALIKGKHATVSFLTRLLVDINVSDMTLPTRSTHEKRMYQVASRGLQRFRSP